MLIVTVGNEKGGAGKTTSVANLAASAAGLGLRVLVVDADPQGQLSNHTLGITAEPGKSLGEVLDLTRSDRIAARDAIVQNNVPELSLLPCERESLDRAEGEMTRNSLEGLTVLRDALRTVDEEYDLCLIDTPPRLLALTTGALVAADMALLVMRPTTLHFAGGDAFSAKVRKVAASGMNPNLKLVGVLFNQAEPGEETAIIEALAEGESWPVLKTRIPDSKLASKANLRNEPVVISDPNRAVSRAYRAAIEEILERTMDVDASVSTASNNPLDHGNRVMAITPDAPAQKRGQRAEQLSAKTSTAR
jgi:chromosome partitioning protein